MAEFVYKQIVRTMFRNFIFLCLVSKISAICTIEKTDWKPNEQQYTANMQKILPVMNMTWVSGQYVVAVCENKQGKYKSNGVVWNIPNVGNIVLGRTNRTNVVAGDDWVLLEYRGGDNGNGNTCSVNSTYSSEILFTCDPRKDGKEPPRFLELAGCVARFLYPTPMLCPQESASIVGPIIAWVMILFTLYCVVGVVYRRCHTNASGRNQIPHLPFWSRIGKSCADACNWACRCEPEFITTWDGDNDRDEALLSP